MRQPVLYAGIVLVSIVLLSCGDDKDTTQQQADQVTNSVNGVNQVMSDIITTYCTCSTPAGGSDLQKCIDQNQPDPLTLSDCQTTATTCDPTSYVAYMNCQRDAYKALDNCIKSCPDSATETQCINAFDSKTEGCSAHITTELSTAFQSCQSNQTPACANAPTPDPKPGSNNCITPDSFLALVSSSTSWVSAYYAGSEGTLPCEDYRACIQDRLEFSSDNTFTSVWMNDPSHKSWAEKYVQLVCSHGTWQLQCDQLILTDCQGTTSATIQLTNEGFKLDSRAFKSSVISNSNAYCTHKSC